MSKSALHYLEIEGWVHTVVVLIAVVVVELELEEPSPLAVAVAAAPVVAEEGLGVASSLQLLAADFTSVP
jgi:hypothetical protein